MIVATLGERRTPGPDDDYLRALTQVNGPGSRDLRAASLVALAKKVGLGATLEYGAAVGHPSADTRSYALKMLAASGDVRGWDAAIEWLRRHYDPDRAELLISYAARQAPMAGREQRAVFASALRPRWADLPSSLKFDIGRFWPQLPPGGPDDPGEAEEGKLIGDWANHSLFTYNTLP